MLDRGDTIIDTLRFFRPNSTVVLFLCFRRPSNAQQDGMTGETTATRIIKTTQDDQKNSNIHKEAHTTHEPDAGRGVYVGMSAEAKNS